MKHFLLVVRSTDSQLKLWNVSKPHCLRSFKGHINEKNFVGLASNGDYIACGKEPFSIVLMLAELRQPQRHIRICETQFCFVCVCCRQ